MDEVETISEEDFLVTPVHDTGSFFYTLLSFFLPPLGLIGMLIFNKFNHKRNARACKTGAVRGLITLGVIVGFFAIMLALVVI